MKGSKYEERMDTAEAAKRIRADVKAAQKAGRIPAGVKVSVRTSRYSMGSSIHVGVTACPFMVQTRDFLRAQATDPHHFFQGERRTPKARSLLGALQEVGSAYRRDDSDSMTDHFDCNFYLHVQFDGSIESEEHRIASELWPRQALTLVREAA